MNREEIDKTEQVLDDVERMLFLIGKLKVESSLYSV